MTDIERLRAWIVELPDEIASWGAYADEYFQQKWKLAEAIEAAKANSAEMLNLIADYERLRGMEERYRWIATHFRPMPKMGGNDDWFMRHIVNLRGPTLEEAIDKAMARDVALVPVPGGEGKDGR